MVHRSILLSLALVAASCTPESTQDETDEATGPTEDVDSAEQSLAIAEYSASNTNSAASLPGTALIPFVINANETVMIGTEGITESYYDGDTYLRLRNPSGTEVTASDNSLCGNLGSKMSFTSPYGTAQTFTVWAGCSGSGSCGVNAPNVVAVSRRKGTFAFNTSNTNSGTVNTTNKQYYFNAGDTIRASTCGTLATGAAAIGNTYLRLYANNAGVYTQIAANDNTTYCGSSCGSSALITYPVPSSGFYQVRAGCSSNTSCSGTVAVYAE